MAKLLEGRPIAERMKEGLKQQIAGLSCKPVLASVMVGTNAGASSYVKSQEKTAESLGIEYRLTELPQETTEEQLVACIEKLNSDKSVNGIIIQMPLPNHLDAKIASCSIAPEKDVEGMNPAHVGQFLCAKTALVPCTAAAVMELIKETGVHVYGKDVVIVGHSQIVGKPLTLLLLEKLATVTVCHIGTSKAGKLADHVRTAEILIVAVGKAGLIKGEWIKEGAVVIDVGINRVHDTIVGDVEFDAAAQRAAWITPVPGGVGPLTVTMLMRNVLLSCKRQP
ncbi:MAG TPA: bifunctional 5,10-methylenetetrahydrofolate dehydrogenase/5,10-methenyltetrahydrofolate cyclohydrolase [Candidatus Omnitrophota bacterium]|nr:bifunctional 5,10-methylenetetrahydrofolate dehydrogenase/5,10-methenyltetrahydrofolate cyclohydrolase [Candidatus Omnitrophota bacterium]